MRQIGGRAAPIIFFSLYFITSVTLAAVIAPDLVNLSCLSKAGVGSSLFAWESKNAATLLQKYLKSDESIYIYNINNLEKSYKLWTTHLPNVKPHYAVKCNPDPEIIAKLASLGAGFDCASPAEIELVLAAGGAPIIYANPCKTNKDIAFAKTNAVSLTTVDSLCELEKIHRIYPEMSLILRIFASDTSAQCVLSNKYGAIEKEWEPILQRARELSMNFAGISFHVGSGAMNPAAFTGAIAQARKLYELGCKYGFAMTLIDIGGGFSVKNFVDMSATIKAALACHFPSAPAATRFTFMAEPGRFFAENVATLLTKVINVRERDGVRDYWLNDGLYGSFNCVLYDHIKLKPFPLKAAAAPKTLATLWGPTCDGFDKICENIELLYLNCDDWLLWTNMGAYTIAGSCNFNGIAAMQPNKIYIN